MTVSLNREQWSRIALGAFGAIGVCFLYIGLKEYFMQPEAHEFEWVSLGVISVLVAANEFTTKDKAVGRWLWAAWIIIYCLFTVLDLIVEAQERTAARWILLLTLGVVLVIGCIQIIRWRSSKASKSAA